MAQGGSVDVNARFESSGAGTVQGLACSADPSSRNGPSPGSGHGPSLTVPAACLAPPVQSSTRQQALTASLLQSSGNPLIQSAIGGNAAAQLALQLAARMPPAAVAAVLSATQLSNVAQPANTTVQLIAQLAAQQAASQQKQQQAAQQQVQMPLQQTQHQQQPVMKPPFSLMSVIGDISGPITLQQAAAVQKAIRSLADPQLAANLAALVNMSPEELHSMLTTTNINLKDVLHRLQHHMDPILAQQHFGDGYSYAKPSAPHLTQPPSADAARQAFVQQLLASGQWQGQSLDVGTMVAMMGAVRPPVLQSLGQQALPQAHAIPAAPLVKSHKPACAQPPRQRNQGSVRGQGGVPSGVESPEATLARLAPNSLRCAVFEVLLTAGPQGMNITDLMNALQARGVGNWQDARSARASLSATCNQEPSILRVAPSTFAVRALVVNHRKDAAAPSQSQHSRQQNQVSRSSAAAGLPLTVQQQRRLDALMVSASRPAPVDLPSDAPAGGHNDGPGSDDEPESLHDDVEEPDTELLGTVPASLQEPYEYNNTHCSGCRKADHPFLSPLVLCDSCPRAYHLACLGLGSQLTSSLPPWAHTLPGGPADVNQLPEGQWSCPRCLERVGLFVPLPLVPAVPAYVPNTAQLPIMTAATAAAPSAAGLQSGQSVTRPGLASSAVPANGSTDVNILDGWEQEANKAKRALESRAQSREEKARVKELQRAEKAKLKDEKGRAAAAMKPVAPDDMDAEAEDRAELQRLMSGGLAALRPPGQHPVGQPTGVFGNGPVTPFLGSSAELAERVAKLKLLVEGPPSLPVLVEGAEAAQVFQETFALSEFSQCFATSVPGVVPMSLMEIQHAIKWPLEASGRLASLYCGLLKLLLASWQAQVAGTPSVARIKRWQRLLSKGRGAAGAWQEILRRYLLACRAGMAVSDEDMQRTDFMNMSDDLAAVHMAVALGKVAYWHIPPTLQLRTLSALLGDAMACKTMHDILNARTDAAAELQNAKMHADADIRRREREGAKQKKLAAKEAKAAEAARKLAEALSVPQPGGVTIPAAAAAAAMAAVSAASSAHPAPAPASAGGKGRGRNVARGRGGGITGGGRGRADSEAAGSGPAGDDELESDALAAQEDGLGGAEDETGMAADDGDHASGLHKRPRVDRLSGEYGGEQQSEAAAAAEWAAREEAFEREMRAASVRADALGSDRHFARYWWVMHGGSGVGCGPGSVVVEHSDSLHLSCLDSQDQVDDLLARLNKRAAREGPLLSTLTKLYPRILEGIQQRQQTPQLHPCPLRLLDSIPAFPVPARVTPLSADEGDIDAKPTKRSHKLSVASLRRSASRSAPVGKRVDTAAGGASLETSEAVDHRQTEDPDDMCAEGTGDGPPPAIASQLKDGGQDTLASCDSPATADHRAFAHDSAQADGTTATTENPAAAGGMSAHNEAKAHRAMLMAVAHELEYIAEQMAKYGSKEVSVAQWRRRLRTATDAASLCDALLECEKDLNVMFDGLPEGADDASLAPQVADVERYVAEFVLPLDKPSATQHAAASQDNVSEAVGEASHEQPADASVHAPDAAAAEQQQQTRSAGSRILAAVATTQPTANTAMDTDSKDSKDAVSLQSDVKADVTVKAEPDNSAAPVGFVKLVTALDEVDDYDPDREIDRERAHERAAQQHMAAQVAAAAACESIPEMVPYPRPYFAFWRGSKERCTFLQDVRRTQLTYNTAMAAFCGLLLADRCNMLLRRMMKDRGALVSDPAAEKAAMGAAAAAAAAAAEKAAAATAQPLGPRKRKLTSLASEAGLSLGAATPNTGQPSRLARGTSRRPRTGDGRLHQSTSETPITPHEPVLGESYAPIVDDQGRVVLERWVCAGCGEEGELLVCEQPNCDILMHPVCAGLDSVPEGEWFCPRHSSDGRWKGPTETSEEGHDEGDEQDTAVVAHSRGRGRSRYQGKWTGGSGRGGARSRGGGGGRARGSGRGRGRRSRSQDNASDGDADGGETTVSEDEETQSE